MEAIRHWALTFCICCILAGIFRVIVPGKGSAGVLKTVLALYILLSAITPPIKTDWSGMWKQLTELPAVTPQELFTLNELTEQQFNTTLAARLEKILHQNGITAVVSVESETDDSGAMQLRLVRVSAGDNAQYAKAEQLLRRQLWETVPIENTAKDVNP